MGDVTSVTSDSTGTYCDAMNRKFCLQLQMSRGADLPLLSLYNCSCNLNLCWTPSTWDQVLLSDRQGQLSPEWPAVLSPRVENVPKPICQISLHWKFPSALLVLDTCLLNRKPLPKNNTKVLYVFSLHQPIAIKMNRQEGHQSQAK